MHTSTLGCTHSVTQQGTDPSRSCPQGLLLESDDLPQRRSCPVTDLSRREALGTALCQSRPSPQG